MITKQREGPNRYLPWRYFDVFSGLFMAFFSRLFGSFSGLCPTPRRKGEPPTTGRKGWGGCQFPPPDSRANFHREGPTPSPRRNGDHWQQEGRARRKGQPPLKKNKKRERSANSPTHLEKEGPNTNPERRGPTHSEKARTTSTPRAKSKKGPSPLKEGMANLLHSKEGPIPAGQTSPHDRRANHHSQKRGRTPTLRRKRPPPLWETPKPEKGGPALTPGRKAQTPTTRRKNQTPLQKKGRANETRREGRGQLQPSTTDRIAFAISCVTPDLTIENWKLNIRKFYGTTSDQKSKTQTQL